MDIEFRGDKGMADGRLCRLPLQLFGILEAHRL